MAQDAFAGATSYKTQSLEEIQNDIKYWIRYAKSTRSFIIEIKENCEENRFWSNIAYNFQTVILNSIRFLGSILYDLKLIDKSIEQSYITEKEVNLLKEIGSNASQFVQDYSRQFYEESGWRDYENPDFRKVEQIYENGKDFFATLLDASSAADRLADYKNQEGNINYLNIQGDVLNSQIQQGNAKSMQSMKTVDFLNYDMVSVTLGKIKDLTLDSDFDIDFGDRSFQIKQVIDNAIKMVEAEDSPTKIQKTLSAIRDLVVGVSSGLIANKICELITKLL